MTGLLPNGCRTINEAASVLIRATVGASHLTRNVAELRVSLDCIKREVEWLAARNDRQLKGSESLSLVQVKGYLNALALILQRSPNKEIRVSRMDVISFALTANFEAEYAIESFTDPLNGDFIFRLTKKGNNEDKHI